MECQHQFSTNYCTSLGPKLLKRALYLRKPYRQRRTLRYLAIETDRAQEISWQHISVPTKYELPLMCLWLRNQVFAYSQTHLNSMWIETESRPTVTAVWPQTGANQWTKEFCVTKKITKKNLNSRFNILSFLRTW